MGLKTKLINLEQHYHDADLERTNNLYFTTFKGEEEYEETMEIVNKRQHYFHFRENSLQYYFPYIIEYEEMQSKYNTTRYLSQINLKLPYIWNFFYFYPFNKKGLIQKYSSWQQYQDLYNTYTKIKRISYQAGIFVNRNNKFYLYKYYYHLMKLLLILNEGRHLAFTEKEKRSITYNGIIDYDKINYYKYQNYFWNLIFQDPIVEKFINMFVKCGKKEKIEKSFMFVFRQFFYFIKEHPLIILKKAIENTRPIIHSKTIPFGRRTKTVPHPINNKLQIKLAMRWIREEIINDKDNKTPFKYRLLNSILNAYKKKGYAYRKMLDTHNEAYAQRAYMYSNYYLKSSKNKNLRPF